MSKTSVFGTYRFAYGFFEPLAFHKRSGLWWNVPAPRDLERWYARGHSAEAAKSLAELGVNLTITHFFKGYGLQAEQEDIEGAKAFIGHCHTHGIKALAYVQFGTIMPETFLNEEPDAETWLREDSQGATVSYGPLYWRRRPCANSTEFIAYLKKAITLALTEANADGIFLDNFFLYPCYCGRCRDLLRAYLEEKYDPQQRMDLFGLGELDHLQLPPEALAPPALSVDPVAREMLWFMTERGEQIAAEMRRYIKSLAPDALFLGHAEIHAEPIPPHKHLSRKVFSYFDMNTMESRSFPQVTEANELISSMRDYKHGLAGGFSVLPFFYMPSHLKPGYRGAGFTAIPTAEEAKLYLAEAAAFGAHSPGGKWITLPYKGGFAWEAPELGAVLKRYFNFFIEHAGDYADAVSAATVVVLDPSMSLIYTGRETLPCLRGIEQALIQGHVVFDIASFDARDADLGTDLSRYRLVVLPAATCMTDAQVQAVRDYIHAGGNLVAIGNGSLYDENVRSRGEYGLADVLGVSHLQDSRPSGARNDYGAGRCLYLSEDDFPPVDTRDQQMVVPLPVGWKEKAQAIEDMGVGAVSTPGLSPNVAVDMYTRADGSKSMLHLVNYDLGTPVKNIEVRLPSTERGRMAEVTCISPDRQGRQELAVGQDGKDTVFHVSSLDVYNLVIIAWSTQAARAGR